jgi:hypothetical protein
VPQIDVANIYNCGFEYPNTKQWAQAPAFGAVLMNQVVQLLSDVLQAGSVSYLQNCQGNQYSRPTVNKCFRSGIHSQNYSYVYINAIYLK